MTASRLRKSEPAFALDNGLAPTAVLRLQTVDVDRVEAELRTAIAAAPDRYLYAPIIVDVAAILDDVAELPLHDLAARLRACKLVPVGAANLPAWAVWNAAAAGIANVQPAPLPKPAPLQAVEATSNATVTIANPVRAGQVVRARDADLVVLATVNAGAELIADGHIHVYGRLRGRATAGASGRRDARVFCQCLEAEVVGVGEQRRIADEIGPKWRGSAAQIWLDGDMLRIGPLI